MRSLLHIEHQRAEHYHRKIKTFKIGKYLQKLNAVKFPPRGECRYKILFILSDIEILLKALTSDHGPKMSECVQKFLSLVFRHFCCLVRKWSEVGECRRGCRGTILGCQLNIISGKGSAFVALDAGCVHVIQREGEANQSERFILCCCQMITF